MTVQPEQSASDGGCERCGAGASVYVCEAACNTSAEGSLLCESTSHAYCKACARELGKYPGFWARTLALLGFFVTLPLMPLIMLKYPPSYWKKKFAEVEAQKQRRPSETGSPPRSGSPGPE